MSLRLLALLFSFAFALSVAAPASEEKKVELPRLTEVNAFPEKYRAAVRAVVSALAANGSKASEYFAEISPTEEGLLEIRLRHESHPADDSGWRGDACGRCRIVRYDPKTGKLT